MGRDIPYTAHIGELVRGGPENIYQWVHVIEERMKAEDCDPVREGPDVAWQPPYYRALAAATYLTKARLAIDLGTRWGHSAVALAKGAKRVLSYDITNAGRRSGERVRTVPDNVEFVILERPGAVATEPPFEEAQVVMVDIGYHEGMLESVVHETLERVGFRGLVLHDDLGADQAIRNEKHPGKMDAFWDSIEWPKATTNWHGPWGFGLVLFD